MNVSDSCSDSPAARGFTRVSGCRAEAPSGAPVLPAVLARTLALASVRSARALQGCPRCSF
eukprot:11591229-Alexandrium_andersonii.AAC.1